jgi:aerobic carbon-monoxide dehydrogenase large subunit
MTVMTKFGAAQPLRRVEDQRFITGQGRYTSDISRPGQAYGHVLRSPHAHARIARIDTRAAASMPGVLAVYTHADLARDKIGDLPCTIPLKNRDGSDRADPPRPALANGRVRHVGDPVAFVVAENLDAARDAAERIEVDYDALNAAGDIRAAAAAGAPLVWDDVPENRCFDWGMGDEKKTAELFARAAHVTRLDVVNNRVVIAPMEPRAALAEFDQGTGRFTLHMPTQGTHMLKPILAKRVFGLKSDRLRIVTPDVGGGFGMKLFVFPEPIMCMYAARLLGRPVKWVADRSESFLSDTHGRDNLTAAEMALDAEGVIQAVRFHVRANMGAYLSTFAPMIPTIAALKVLPSVYRMQAVSARVEGLFSNTVPVDAYRGAGRPETNYVIERLIDTAAQELGIDRVELRRRNFIPPESMPWSNAAGLTYDSGEYARVLDVALEQADWTGFAARKRQSAARGFRRGIGLAFYLEATSPPGSEHAQIVFPADGKIEVRVGTQSNGQGHETAYTQIVAERLGVDPASIRVVQGDSDLTPTGGGTGGSRSLYMQGTALLEASVKVIEKGKAAAGEILEAAAADIEFGQGRFRIAGTDRAIGLLELADRLRKPGDAATSLDTALDATPAGATFPYGCHIAELEVDPATGAIALLRYVVADDMGRILNPPIARGQIQGGVVQGLGQAFLELAAYDQGGQLLSGSFMDYGLPRADDVPDIEVTFVEVPCLNNPLGIKGAGEAGAIGSCPAAINALVDALRDDGVRHIDMPATPERVWRAIHAATRG